MKMKDKSKIRDIIVVLRHDEYSCLLKYCGEKAAGKSEACREAIRTGIGGMEEELAFTGSIVLEISNSFEICGKPEKLHVYLTEYDRERIGRLAGFTGLSVPKLARYLLSPLIH